MTAKKNTNGLSMIFLGLSAVSTVIGLLSGFLYSYKTSTEDYARYTQMLNETRRYQSVLRKEVKENAENKMGKELAWQQINKLSNRIEYLERHQNGEKKS